MYRIQLTKNPYCQKPKAAYIAVLKPEFDILINFASNKLKLSKKKIRLYICKNCPSSKPGTELTRQSNLEFILCNDIMLYASENSYHKTETIRSGKKYEELISKISKPPRYPYPNYSTQTEIDSITDDINMTKNVFKNKPSQSYSMSNIFPILDGDIIHALKSAIKDNPSIEEIITNDGYTSFDYRDTIQYDKSDNNKKLLQKECRGLIVSNRTGKILARRFHKFYNIGENSESKIDQIDFTGCRVYEKLDGSLVSPILLDDPANTLIWATRRARSTIVEEFVKPNHIAFSIYWLKQNITPLYEWCVGQNQPGILRYEHDSLVLIGLRHNITGNYITFESASESISEYNIVTPKEIPFVNFTSLAELVNSWVDREGVTIWLQSGAIYKLKTSWWVSMSLATKHGGSDGFLFQMLKINPSLKNIPADRIIITALSADDDVISQIIAKIKDDNEAQEFHKLIRLLDLAVQQLITDINLWILESYQIVNDHITIKNIFMDAGWPDWIIDQVLTDKSVGHQFEQIHPNNIDKNRFIKYLINLIKKPTGIKIIKGLFDINWNTSNCRVNVTDTILDIWQFNQCSERIKTHILNTYFPKKLANMTGVKTLLPQTIINIQRNYSSDEGKIVGMYERFVKDNIHDLRIDIQQSRKSGYTNHYGCPEYALMLVQYGLPKNNPSVPHGEFAGVLIPTETNILSSCIINALSTSFNTQRIVRMARRLVSDGKHTIFCDLDGVLVDFVSGVQKLTGRSPSNNQNVSKMWSRISSCPGFFVNLPWMNDGHVLWNFIKKFNPTILTGLPYSFKKFASKDKMEWCKKNLGVDINVVTCMTSEKYRYANQNSILIDDNLETGRKWKISGGHFIHHQNAIRTIYEIEKYFGALEQIKINPNYTITPYQCSQEIKLVNSVPTINCNIIGVDIEWDYRNDSIPISIIQLATPDIVYIIDMANASSIVWDQIHDIMANNQIIKLFFDVENTDMNRIGCNICCAIDLKEWAFDCLVGFNTDDSPSLSKLAKMIICKDLEKTKSIQSGNWNIRPLTSDQIKYAVNDAAVLLEIYNSILKNGDKTCIIPWKNIYLSTTSPKSKKMIKDEYDPFLPTKIIYTAIFLYESSTTKIKELYPPKFSNIYCDHVTITYTPSTVNDYPVGELVNIYITGYYEDNMVQCVRVHFGTDTTNVKLYHITISTNTSINPKTCMEITEYQSCDPIMVSGIYGLVVAYDDDPLIILPSKIRSKIMDFYQNAQPGQTIKFKPNELSSAERSVIHQFAEINGIMSESTGKDNNRKITLTMLKNKHHELTKTDINNNIHIYEHPDDKQKLSKSKTFRINDRSILQNMNIVHQNRNIWISGYIMNHDISWRHNNIVCQLQQDRVMVILRGLPGSGKSFVSKYLVDKYQFNICSADDYFWQFGCYQFDRTNLHSAHQYCYQQAQILINNNQKIIIDNTNSIKTEYVKYLTLAEEKSYLVLVIEIFCQDSVEAKFFAQRSIHFESSNKYQIVENMYNRWETDDSAIYLSAYHDYLDYNLLNDGLNNISNKTISLEKWLSDNKLYHNSKKRTKTHLFGPLNNRPACYLDIPIEMRDHFYQVYYASGIFDDKSDEPKYLTELPGQKFKMYFDIDCDYLMVESEIIYLVQQIQGIVKSCIYVTGLNDISTRLHLKCPDCIVDYEGAMHIRLELIQILQKEIDKNWNAIIDSNVYLSGIRSFGSRKITKGMDLGRVYKLMFVVESNGLIDHESVNKNKLSWQILKQLSIHI